MYTTQSMEGEKTNNRESYATDRYNLKNYTPKSHDIGMLVYLQTLQGSQTEILIEL